jgi:hypothetical protein
MKEKASLGMNLPPRDQLSTLFTLICNLKIILCEINHETKAKWDEFEAEIRASRPEKRADSGSPNGLKSSSAV